MKTLYLDCGMGAAGDMLTAVLPDLLPDREAAVAGLNAIGVPHVVYGCTSWPRSRCWPRWYAPADKRHIKRQTA